MAVDKFPEDFLVGYLGEGDLKLVLFESDNLIDVVGITSVILLFIAQIQTLLSALRLLLLLLEPQKSLEVVHQGGLPHSVLVL
jgi:hypothetical protein